MTSPSPGSSLESLWKTERLYREHIKCRWDVADTRAQRLSTVLGTLSASLGQPRAQTAQPRTDTQDKASANSRLARCGDNDPVSPVLLKIFLFYFYKTHLFFITKF